MSVWSDQAAGFLEICESSSSEVWKHFLKNRHTEKARCKTCLFCSEFSSPEASLHKNHKKTLKIGTSGIRIWGIGIRLPKWSEYIRISDNSDIRTSTLVNPGLIVILSGAC